MADYTSSKMRMRIAAVVFLVATALAFPANAAVDLYTVQNAVEEQGFKWVAGDTLLGLLSPQERRGYAGLNPISKKEHGAAPLWAPAGASILPERFDWRHVKETCWIGPPDDQMGDPVSHALSAANNLGDLIRIAQSDPQAWLPLSHESLLAPPCAPGSLVSVLDYMVDNGIPVEGSGLSLSAGLTGWEWVTLDWVDVEAIKQAVRQGPVITTMRVFEDFLFYQGGIYESLGMGYLGEHVVRIVGWDDATRTWIVQNSWGEEWGEGGYAWMYWDDPVTQLGRYTVIQHARVSLDKHVGSKVSEASSSLNAASTAWKKVGASPWTDGSGEGEETLRLQASSMNPQVLPDPLALLAWDASERATKYRLEVNTSPDWDPAGRVVYFEDLGNVLTVEVTGIPRGVVCYWRVWAGNDAGWSEPAEGPSFMVENEPEPQPQPESPTLPAVPYDLNDDGVVDILDVMIVAASWNTVQGDPEYNPVADLNQDGRINIQDILLIATHWKRKK